MSTLNDRLHIIHQFENGELDSAVFNDLLNADPLLKEEYEFGLSIEEAILDDDIQTFKSVVANAQKAYSTSDKKPKQENIFLSRKIAASFSVILLLVLGYFSMKTDLLRSTDQSAIGLQKYEKYYYQFELIDNRVSSLATENRKQAYHAYENNDFDSALSYFEKLEHKEDWEKICIANCYIGLKKIDLAIEHLGPIAKESKDLLVKNQALWYLSLCQLKKGEVEQAQRNLKMVKNSYGQDNVIKLSELLLKEL